MVGWWDISCNQSKHGVLVTEKSKNYDVSDLQGNIRNDQFAYNSPETDF